MATNQKIISKEQRKKFLALLERELFKIKLKDKKVGVLADTHIGNKKQNLNYINSAYDTFDKEGIRSVFHLGDLFEGYPYDLDEQQKQNCCRKELDYLSKEYPYGFTNYIIFGNHDEQFELIGIDLNTELVKHRKDFIPLGTGTGYALWLERRIALKHKTRIKQSPIYINNCDLYLEGHSHFYEYKVANNLLKIPTCSDVQPNQIEKGKHEPGFLILDGTKENVISHRYILENNKSKHILERVLK